MGCLESEQARGGGRAAGEAAALGPLLVGILLAALCGCDAPGKPDPAHRPLRPSEVTDFAALFGQNCTGCHGAEGRLGPALPLNDPLFLAIVPDSELESVVAAGRPGTLMPAFARSHGGGLTDEQVAIIIQGIRQAWAAEPAARWQPSGVDEPGDADMAPRAPPTAIEPLPLYSLKEFAVWTQRGNAVEGKRVFATACAGCHGPNGEGTAVAGAVNQPAFLALISDQALRRLIITGRPDLGMPDFRTRDGRPPEFQPLGHEEIADLMALLEAWRRGAEVASR